LKREREREKVLRRNNRLTLGSFAEKERAYRELIRNERGKEMQMVVLFITFLISFLL
jgi:hypothetical protein